MINVKPGRSATPFGVTTRIAPDAAFEGTSTVILPEFTTVNGTDAPPINTCVAPVKYVPLIVTICPADADAGENDVIVGSGFGRYVNPALLAEPDGVVTATLPDAPAPTIAVMRVALTTVKDCAGVPPKLTWVAPVKLLPLIVTTVPVVAKAGVNDVSVGAGGGVGKVKLVDDVAVPPFATTVTLPVVPAPTVAVICVGESTVYELTAVLPILTDVTPLKFVPRTVTTVPAPPVVGENALMLGGGK